MTLLCMSFNINTLIIHISTIMEYLKHIICDSSILCSNLNDVMSCYFVHVATQCGNTMDIIAMFIMAICLKWQVCLGKNLVNKL